MTTVASDPWTESERDQASADARKPASRIRSYVLRQGRFTPAQQRAFEQLWPSFGASCEPDHEPHPEQFGALFDAQRPCILEIGFGNGEALLYALEREPGHNVIGVEVHLPGVGRLLRTLDPAWAGRVRVFRHDAVEVLQRRIPTAALSEIRIYFPDPWHKKRHQKRRLIQAEFLALAASRLRPGGRLHMATDWEDYAVHMLAVARGEAQLRNLSPTNDFIARPETRPRTHFEQRGVRLGHGVWDLLFERV